MAKRKKNIVVIGEKLHVEEAELRVEAFKVDFLNAMNFHEKDSQKLLKLKADFRKELNELFDMATGASLIESLYTDTIMVSETLKMEQLTEVIGMIEDELDSRRSHGVGFACGRVGQRGQNGSGGAFRSYGCVKLA